MFKSQISKELKNKRVKLSFKEEIEPQEILLDAFAQKKERELGISEKKFEVPLPQKALLIFYSLFLILIFVLFAKTFQLQVIDNKNLSLLAEENRLRTFLIRSERGVIYDRAGKLLVFNQASFDLILDKRDLPKEERERVFSEVSKIIKKDYQDLERETEESDFPQVLISQNLNQETLVLFETKIASGELPGFQIERNIIRNYLDGQNFAHLIGYTGRIDREELKIFKNYSISDYIGKTGLEKSYEEILRGRPGILEMVRDAYGNKRSERKASDPQEGESLVLWLDSQLQKKIETELLSMLEKIGSKKAAAIAVDPKTGGVLSLVSIPSFDNNLISKGISKEGLQKILADPLNPLFNRAISGEYLTGSTIKPLIASAVLEEKIISPDKKIQDIGYIQVPHQYNPEVIYTFYDWKAHGWVDLRKAIAVSANVYFYMVGGGYKDQKGLGPERIKKYLQLFGWGQKLGIDLPQEVEGLIPEPQWKEKEIGENWYTGNTYHLSIGQGYLRVTPLQVAMSFAAIANGGKLLKPQVVQKIVDKEKNIIKEFQPEILRGNFIDQKNLQIVREGMREAVIYGSAVTLNDLPVKAAAKTGTAQIPKEGYYHSWVTVFAPYEDPPAEGEARLDGRQIVLTIVIEDVKGLQPAALQTAKEILRWYFGR